MRTGRGGAGPDGRGRPGPPRKWHRRPCPERVCRRLHARMPASGPRSAGRGDTRAARRAGLARATRGTPPSTRSGASVGTAPGKSLPMSSLGPSVNSFSLPEGECARKQNNRLNEVDRKQKNARVFCREPKNSSVLQRKATHSDRLLHRRRPPWTCNGGTSAAGAASPRTPRCPRGDRGPCRRP